MVSLQIINIVITSLHNTLLQCIVMHKLCMGQEVQLAFRPGTSVPNISVSAPSYLSNFNWIWLPLAPLLYMHM